MKTNGKRNESDPFGSSWKLATLIFLVACFLSMAAFVNDTQPPKPPVSFPFGVQKGGMKIEREIQVAEYRAYLFNLRLMYRERDEADRRRVRKLAGEYEKNVDDRLIEPGVPILLRFKIYVIDISGERLIVEQEISELRMTSYGADFFDKRIAEMPLRPGRYRISVESLKDVPELVGTPVAFSIGFLAKSSPIQ